MSGDDSSGAGWDLPEPCPSCGTPCHAVYQLPDGEEALSCPNPECTRNTDDLEEPFELRLRAKKADLIEVASCLQVGLAAKTNAGEMVPPDHRMIHGLVHDLDEMLDVAGANQAMMDRLETGDVLVGESVEPELVALDGTPPEDRPSGIYRKYRVFKDGEPVEDCFVLKPPTDPAAIAALRTYAEETDNADLAADIEEWLTFLDGESSNA